MQCRPRGHSTWSEGVSLNVSRTGVLFHVEELIPQGTPVEMILAISSPTVDLPPADVMCTGRIVRTEYQTPPGTGPALAATIESYSFIRP